MKIETRKWLHDGFGSTALLGIVALLAAVGGTPPGWAT